tara:strand:- start:265 stop:798 length:534 start_codon:yes stop_codon:yes gene_type:complete
MSLIVGGVTLTGTQTLDATKLTGNLPAISGASLTGISTGKMAQVVAGSSAGVVTTSSTSYSVITTVNITPSANDSKILLLGTVGEPDQCDGRLAARFFVGSTEITSSEDKILQEMGRGLSNTGSETHRGNSSQSILHSPNSTSQQTYTIKIARSGSSGTVRVGNGGSNTIIAIEVLA